jgi:hypothetical protein
MMNLLLLQSLLQRENIKVFSIIENNKASEVYVKTTFIQDDGFKWDTYVPFVDRRAGLDIKTEEELAEYLKSLKQYFTPSAMEKWKKEELQRGLIGGDVTPIFFDVLLSFKEEFENFPMNPNSARRIQDIKDAGYTIASIPRPRGLKGYNRILLPIPLHAEMGYETFTPQFKARVIRLLRERNAFEARVTAKKALIPDHKFSEVRWDEETKAENSMDMTDAEIIQKFQLLDNQRNQQKREICRRCYQEKIRGTIYGINYFYKGTERWDPAIPEKGKAAEKGCEGCAWYDIEKWRTMLNNELNKK